MKIAILMGRGIEGCGNTKCALVCKEHFDAKGHPTDIFATIDRKWPRAKAHDFDLKCEFTCAEDAQTDIVIKALNCYDLVIVYSVPPKAKKEKANEKENDTKVRLAQEKCVDNFVRICQEVTTPKVSIQVDHSVHSLSRNGKLDEISEAMDLLFAHSLTGDFAKWIKKNDISTELCEYVLGYTYDEHRKKYWKDIGEVDPKAFKWIGRSTGWKGPELAFTMHREHLREAGFLTSLEGMEMSIGSLSFFFKNGNRADGPREDVECAGGKKDDKDYDTIEHGGPAYAFGPYNFDEAMERVSRSGFGSDLYHLKAEKYGKSIENCHGDVISAGSIPVFHKHFGENCKSLVTGKPYIEHEHTGTIWVDDDNVEEMCKAMIAISENPQLVEIMRERAYKFWKEHTDAEVTWNYFAEIIKEKLGLEF
jgi:hypothetical protein